MPTLYPLDRGDCVIRRLTSRRRRPRGISCRMGAKRLLANGKMQRARCKSYSLHRSLARVRQFDRDFAGVNISTTPLAGVTPQPSTSDFLPQRLMARWTKGCCKLAANSKRSAPEIPRFARNFWSASFRISGQLTAAFCPTRHEALRQEITRGGLRRHTRQRGSRYVHARKITIELPNTSERALQTVAFTTRSLHLAIGQ